jgi:hypothetical protein
MATPPPSAPQLSSLPSVTARIVAFAAIILAGSCGGMIGWAMVRLQCDGTCSTQKSIGALIGTLLFAGGSAVIAVLALRALAEWNANK